MLNWDLVAAKLGETRPGHTELFRVAIYSRMSMVEGQEWVARNHVKWMQTAVKRDRRFVVHKVYQDFGVSTRDCSRMLCYQKLLDDCRAGQFDLVMAHDLSRIGSTYDDFMKNIEPVSEVQPDIGFVFFKDNLFSLSSHAREWAENMARGDYSSCHLPYFVGAMLQPLDRSEI